MTAIALALTAVVVAAAAGLAVLRRRFVAVTVRGVSMQPTLQPGDRVLVRRAGLGAVRAGQVVVLGTPQEPGTEWMIKRAVAVPGDVSDGRPVPAGKLLVLGDNAAFSLDSRRLGYLPGEGLLGVVVRRLSRGPHLDFGGWAADARAAGGTTRAGAGPAV